MDDVRATLIPSKVVFQKSKACLGMSRQIPRSGELVPAQGTLRRQLDVVLPDVTPQLRFVPQSLPAEGASDGAG